MCGIVGYVGKGIAKNAILKGLESLEYRGYDSAGIALIENDSIFVEKKKGKLNNLVKALTEKEINSNLGIGHTRWATHGEPSDRNSHPHLSMDKTIAVVHNGIIENYLELKRFLEEKGFTFMSETDTEVVAHLLQYNYTGNMKETVFNTIKQLEGSYALGIIHKDYPEVLFCARKNSPLVIGCGNNENLIASDVPALLNYTRDVYFLENGDIGVLSKNNIDIYDEDGNTLKREKTHIQWNLDQATKNGYPHFMLKEIFEQPKALRETINRMVHEDNIGFENILSSEELEKINKVYIVACGTAYHAGLQGKYALNKISKLEANVEVASEFRYSDPFVDEKTLAIFVSQSGETLDTLEAMKEAKSKGAMTMAITNVVGSSISREAHKVIYTMAGPEIAVASTKAYTTQMIILYLLAIYIGKNRNTLSKKDLNHYLNIINQIPNKIEQELKNKEKVATISKLLVDKNNGFYIGRGLDYQTALEGSLKMKEITYIHTEAFPSGELKHGSIALIENGTPVIVLATQRELIDKSISNIKELKARGAFVITIGFNNENLRVVSDEFIPVENINDIFSGFISIIPLQLLAYYTSVEKNIDVDKPRNLAKSVTVE
ncbi:glutamine--fructose-6-phosphate transaminase (isomerizing) [Cetobacterium ceti]